MGKLALVTGATGGIGSRVCKRLLSAGWEVLAASRSPEKLSELKAQTHHLGQLSVMNVDFSSRENTTSFVNNLLESGLELAGMVLIYPRVPRSEGVFPSPDLWLTLFEHCFVLPLEAVRAALSLMGKGAKVVVVSGISNTQVFPQLPTSNVLRTAWLAEAKTLAHTYGPSGIHVNTVSFGGTLTEKFIENLELRKDAAVSSVYEDSPANIPLGHYGDPEDAARVIESMLSNFSNHITGANIICDGGLTRRY
jgi:3-oxoacyl-[acyl-carrier protein] reductase